jgi:hypothetical protein
MNGQEISVTDAVHGRNPNFDWDRIDNEIEIYSTLTAEGRLSTMGGGCQVDDQEIIFEYGKLDLAHQRWVPDEGKGVTAIGGSFTDQDEALAYIDEVLEHAQAIDVQACDVPSILPPTIPD